MYKDLYRTDPEFMERFEHFAFDEVVNEPGEQLEPEDAVYGDIGVAFGVRRS